MQRRKFLTNTMGAAALLTSSEALCASEKNGFIVRNGEARMDKHTPFMGVNPNDLKISSKDTDGALSVFEYTGVQKVGPPLHIHFHQDEIFYVAEGEYIFQLDKERFTLKAGDTIFLPRNIPHTWVQVTEKGRLIYFLQPAGKMEEYFQAVNKIKGVPSTEEIQKLCLQTGQKVLGPPISL